MTALGTGSAWRSTRTQPDPRVPTVTACARWKRWARTTSASRPTTRTPNTTCPYSEAYIEKLCVGLADDQAYKILRGNAIKMLELDRV